MAILLNLVKNKYITLENTLRRYLDMDAFSDNYTTLHTIEIYTQGPIEEIYLEEVITQMGKMKKNKACGPDCLPIEVAKALGDEGAIWMTGVLNEAMRKGIPEEWRTSTITPIYKQKGDPLECNNFRGITLLSHTLKLWERVVESRLRKMVNINRESQRSNHCSAYGCYKKNTESLERS